MLSKGWKLGVFHLSNIIGHCGVILKVGYFNPNIEKIDINFSLNFKINSHQTYSISSYQRLLLDLIKVKLNEGFNYHQVGQFLHINGYKTTRNKEFTGRHVERIIKKYSVFIRNKTRYHQSILRGLCVSIRWL